MRANRRNPFEKYLGPEDHIHKKLMDYLRLKYKRRCLFWHTPNEGKRKPFEKFKASWLGITKGVSDIIILCRGKILALEVKAVYASGSKNYLSKEQKKFHFDVMANGGFVGKCWTFDEGKQIIDAFISKQEDSDEIKTLW